MVREFIGWCNQNEGFFSLILSMIAIGISIYAIGAQNRSTVYKERLDAYCEIENICLKMERILDARRKSVNQDESNITFLLLDNRKQIMLVEKTKDLITCSQIGGRNSAEHQQLIRKYWDIYSGIYSFDELKKRTRLFYADCDAECLLELIRQYDNLIFDYILFDYSHTSQQLEKLENLINNIQKKNILKRMKRKLPI